MIRQILYHAASLTQRKRERTEQVQLITCDCMSFKNLTMFVPFPFLT